MKQLSDTRESGIAYRPGFRGIAIAVINHFPDRSLFRRFIDSARVISVEGNFECRQVLNRELPRFGEWPYSVSIGTKHDLIRKFIFDARSFNNTGDDT
ncbi:MAG: hypothetical protein OXN17_01850 [Candidatus Poribacteria bacterium]|nr:hypothetical protein [Candidatus Poribacteria bacterium]MDE0506126.1 hypothetical protein [Candidatus Poribacteria bacterium]